MGLFDRFKNFLPDVFMKGDEPTDFVGNKYRTKGAKGFIDDRVRGGNDVVGYAPRKIIPDLLGGGTQQSENFPLEVGESNVPRQSRGIKIGTLTGVHDQLRTFDISVATFNDTLDDTPPAGEQPAWNGKPNPTTTQPANPYNAKYPYNHVRETESGHLFEADDTPDNERIKESHRSGTYYEIFPNGSKVEKIVRDNFTLIVGSDRVDIQGSVIVTCEQDVNFYTKGNFTHQVNGDYNLLVKGKYTEQIADKVTHDHHSDYFHYVGNPIEPSLAVAGIGRGNKGGDAKIEVASDYKLAVTGVVSEIYGDPDLYDSFGITTLHQKTVFGNEEAVIKGGKSSIIEKPRIDVFGEDHAVLHGQGTVMPAAQVVTTRGGLKQYIDGESIMRSKGSMEFSAALPDISQFDPLSILGSALNGTMGSVLPGVGDVLGGAVDGVLSGVTDAVGGAISGVTGSLAGALPVGFPGGLGGVGGALGGVAGGLGGVLSGATGAVSGVVGGALGSVAGGALSSISGVLPNVSNLLDPVGLLDNILGGVSSVIELNPPSGIDDILDLANPLDSIMDLLPDVAGIIPEVSNLIPDVTSIV